MRSIRYLVLCVFISFPNYSANTLKGDASAAPGETFSFPIKAHVTGKRFYTGAHNQTGGTFSIARVNAVGDAFEGLTPERVTLNGQPNQLNPLHNSQINFLKLLGKANRPVAVTQQLTDMFLIQEQKPTLTTVLRAQNIKDSGGATTAGIVGIETIDEFRTVAAVKGAGEVDFGDGNSGIAHVALGNVQEVEIFGTNQILQQFNAQPGATDVRAALLNTTTDAVKIVSDLTGIGNVVDLYWSYALDILYIVLQVEAGAGATDGARAVVAAHFEGTNLVFTPIAPDAVFSGATDKIVGAIGANEQVSIQKVRVLSTSKSRLTYLIVQGDNGAPGTTARSVFALPVVNTRTGKQINFETQGTLADVTQTPVNVFNDEALDIFLGRRFVTPATSAAEVFTNTSPPALVGGGDVPAGDIDDMFVIGETVFVVVGSADPGQNPGIFYSEALLDENSMIIGWSNWQRVAGTTDQTFGASLFHIQNEQSTWDGSFVFITGSDINSIRTVKKTVWSKGASDGLQPLSNLLSQSFAQSNGGIRGLFNFPQQLASLNGVSTLVSTGRDKIAFIESGRTIGGTFTPNAGQDFNKARKVFTQGAIEETFAAGSETRYIEISGGVLDSLQPIVAAEIANDVPAANGWLFVAGIGGVAVLADQNGQGWDIGVGELANGFVGLTDQMTFKLVGSYSNVRKLISDRGFLYILTDTTFDRINLQTSDFATNTLDVTTLATLNDLQSLGSTGSFLDVIVSEKIAIVSTSVGLFRIGNNKDITMVTSATDAAWTKLDLPNSVIPILRLFAISSTGLAQDVSRNGGGMVYALNAYQGFNQARINRIAIKDTSASAITNDTIIPFNDLAFENFNSFFITFRSFRQLINTDGAVTLSSIDQDLKIPPELFTGTDLLSTVIPLSIENSSDIVQLVRSTASGSWLVSGDFGLKVNE